jgi:tRNA threonylcarbamoyl adenosine modification protein YjeE
MSFTLALADEAATEVLGRRLAVAARSGDVIALVGPLGAGKTTLARAFIRALTSAGEEVPSPTFTLVQTYAGSPGPIWHFDLFRLSRPEEALELGIEDAFAEGIVLIEWPERLGALLPAHRLEVRLDVAADGDSRKVEITGASWNDRLRVLGLSDRDATIDAWLTNVGWSGARRTALAGDASFRRYWRIIDGARHAVLMDAPPDKLDLGPFLAIDAHLRGLGYSSPELFAADRDVGLALLEDLGDATLGARLAAGDDPFMLYGLAIDWLIDLHRRGAAALPPGLPDYDDARLLEEVERFVLWYVPGVRGAAASESARRDFAAIWQSLLPVARAVPATLVYRDFFVENLMLLPRPGLAALGLLDFQDAVVGPITYDLASLLEDARRDLATDLIAAMRARYLDAFPALDRDAFAASWAAMAAHRHVKCLGLFVRLAKRDGKPGYLRHVPRLWRLLGGALAHPALGELARWLDTEVPAALRVIPPR